MEPLERELAKVLRDDDRVPRGPARLLVVGGSERFHEACVAPLIARKHDCTCVPRLDEARSALARARFDLVLLAPVLADGDGLDLLRTVHKTAPSTKVIIVAARPDPAMLLAAMRTGAIDCIDPESGDCDAFLERVEAALIRARVEQAREERLTRLKKICRELNVARREVGQQVDGLCEDLAAAYQDIATQMNDVAMATEFRTLLKQELDVEDLLRTALEYLLTKTGPTNAAVFLSDHQQGFGLGAYVNYDCPRETVSVLLDHLCHAICPQMIEERDIIEFEDAGAFAQWVGVEPGILEDSQVIAFSCHGGGECLAVVVLFRHRREPFPPELASTIDTLRTIFSRQLADVIRIHHRAAPAWPEEACEDEPDQYDDYGFGFGGGIAA